MMQEAPVVAVLDIGKTNLKLLISTPDGEPLEQVSRINGFQLREPYQAIDVEGVINWLLDALPPLSARHPIAALIPCAHGCTGHLCDENGPVLPMMDYEAVPPADIDAAYAKIAPSYAETMTSIGPGAMRIAKQLFWQQSHFQAGFARAGFYLTMPQYIAWRLGGRRASEITQIAAQGHLWAPLKRDFSSIVDSQNWRRLFPPFARAGETLGPVRADLARRAGLRADAQILCGVHDSNANLFRYKAAGMAANTIFSTGTWMIGFERSRDLATADANAGMVSNMDVDFGPVASSLTMAGREYSLIAGAGMCGDDEALAEVAGLIARKTMAMPSFVADDGLFPGSSNKGHIVGPPPENAAQRRALAALYAAFTAHFCLEALQSRTQPVIVDGGFANNFAFARLLAALRAPQEVKVSRSSDGTALGAALLWRRFERVAPVTTVAVQPVEPFPVSGLRAAAEEWRLAATALHQPPQAPSKQIAARDSAQR